PRCRCAYTRPIEGARHRSPPLAMQRAPRGAHALQAGVQRVDEAARARTVGADRVESVHHVGEADVRIRIAEADRAANAVVAEGAWIRSHVDRIGGIQQDSKPLVVMPLLHDLDLVMLLADHALDRSRAHEAPAVVFATGGEHTVNTGDGPCRAMTV